MQITSFLLTAVTIIASAGTTTAVHSCSRTQQFVSTTGIYAKIDMACRAIVDNNIDAVQVDTNGWSMQHFCRSPPCGPKDFIRCRDELRWIQQACKEGERLRSCWTRTGDNKWESAHFTGFGR